MGKVIDKEIHKAAARLQQPGTSVTFSAGDKSATIEDPREVCLNIAAQVEFAWMDDADLMEQWPRDEHGDPVEYAFGHVASRIGHALISKIQRLKLLADFEVGYLYRNKDPWESAGRTVYGKMNKVGARESFYTDHHFELVINWNIWREMTPWQKVALVYHELRHGDTGEKGKPAIQGHQLECFFDELELFGTATYRDWARLERAANAGELVRVQYHLAFPEEGRL